MTIALKASEERAVIIGKICEEPKRTVEVHIHFDGIRMINMLVGDSLPRSC